MTDRDATQRSPLFDRAIPYIALVLGLLALFLLAVRPVLSPLVLFLALLLALGPFTGTRWHRNTVLLLGGITALWLLQVTGALLAPFVVALALGYILHPAVDALAARRVPRPVGVLILMIPVILGIAAVAIFGVPALVREIEGLIRKLPEAIQNLAKWLETARWRILGWKIPFVDERELVRRIQSIDAQKVSDFLQQRQADIAKRAWQGVLGVGRGVGFVVGLLGYVVLTPVLLFYLLRDWDTIESRLTRLVPVPQRPRWLGFIREYDTLLSRYLRGQLTEATLVGVLTWLGLLVLGFPYAGLVGAVAGVFNVVPYLGLVASLVPAVVIALFSGSILASLAKVAGVFVVVQFLDGTVLGPRIVGGSVGLHPVWIILALAVGGSFFGFVGLLLAVPAAVLVKLILREAMLRYERSATYRGTAETPTVPYAES